MRISEGLRSNTRINLTVIKCHVIGKYSVVNEANELAAGES